MNFIALVRLGISEVEGVSGLGATTLFTQKNIVSTVVVMSLQNMTNSQTSDHPKDELNCFDTTNVASQFSHTIYFINNKKRIQHYYSYPKYNCIKYKGLNFLRKHNFILNNTCMANFSSLFCCFSLSSHWIDHHSFICFRITHIIKSSHKHKQTKVS